MIVNGLRFAIFEFNSTERLILIISCAPISLNTNDSSTSSSFQTIANGIFE
jgi:hypothetical protein